MATIIIDEQKCTACASCVDSCPVELFELTEKDGRKFAAVAGDPDDCIDCQACLADCEGDAITLE